MKTFKIARLAAVLAAAALCASLAACSAPMASNESSAVRDTAMLPNSAGGADMAALDGQMVDVTSPASPQGRSIISSGGISIEVGDVQQTATEVARIATELGGYVESQHVGGNTHNSTSIDTAMLTLRVPSDKFDLAFAELSELGTVIDENRTATDVTAQHVDLTARVDALQTSVDRLTELMASAATTGELIEVEAALAARQAELDGLRAQLNALEDQVDEATIWVSVSHDRVIAGGPANFWEGLLAGLQSLSVAGAGALVLFGVLLPWLAIAAVITLIVIVLVRAARRRKARRHTKQTAAQSAQTPAAEPAPATQPAGTSPPTSGE